MPFRRLAELRRNWRAWNDDVIEGGDVPVLVGVCAPSSDCQATKAGCRWWQVTVRSLVKRYCKGLTEAELSGPAVDAGVEAKEAILCGNSVHMNTGVEVLTLDATRTASHLYASYVSSVCANHAFNLHL